MRKLKIIFGIVLVLIIILVAATSFVIYHYSHRALPDYNKNPFINGLSGTVEVYRDSFAVPHIYAKNERDLYRVVGYITAQDRMWQMDLLRRVTTGRLSEIFGSDLLKTDILMRSLRIPEKSKKVLAQCPSSIIDALEAYTDGVNQYIKEYYDKLPIEFTILGYKPEPWKVEHSVNLIGYIAWDLNGCWNSEIVLHKLAAKLSKSQLADFIPSYDSIQSAIFIAACQFTKADWRSELMNTSSKLEELGLQVFHGSNNWVVSGSKTVSGKPILANDMHLGFSAPGIWYQIHEVVPGKLNVSGVLLPGQPLVVSGHNDSVAWGLTNVMNDDIDFYRETLSSDSTKYRFDGKWRNLIIKHETFFIRGGNKVNIDLKFTHRGPIISMLKNIKDETISMRWIGNEMSNEIQSIYLLDRTRNWSDFCNAMKTFKSVSQNVAYADHRGNIGMYCCAGVPIRKGSPIEVMPGDTSAYDWQGFIPFNELPHKFNPSEGYAVSANNRTVAPSYPHYISAWFDLSFRYDRISEMLRTDKKFTISDIAAIQTDFTSKFAQYYLPVLVDVIKKQPDLSTTGKLALKALENWKGQINAQSKEAAIFEVFYNRFVENVVKDEMGDELYNQFLVDKILVRNTIHNIWRKKASVLCDDITTPNKLETFDDMVVKSFNESLQYLQEQLGTNMQNWEWGKIHTLTLEHPLSKVKILDRIFHLNRGPFDVGGSFHTVATYSYRYNKLFAVNSGASQRHIYNIANWDNSVSVIPSGNSGIPSSAHYCDQTKMYFAGHYHVDLFSDSAVRKNYRYKAVFSPSK